MISYLHVLHLHWANDISLKERNLNNLHHPATMTKLDTNESKIQAKIGAYNYGDFTLGN